MDTRVLIVNAMGVVTEEYLWKCALTRFQRTNTNCKDFIHPGVDSAISIDSQLIFNDICETPTWQTNANFLFPNLLIRLDWNIKYNGK